MFAVSFSLMLLVSLGRCVKRKFLSQFLLETSASGYSEFIHQMTKK